MFLDLHINLSNHSLCTSQKQEPDFSPFHSRMAVSALGDSQVCGDLGAFVSIYVLPRCDWSAQVAREIVFRPLNPVCSAFWYSSYYSKIPFGVLNESTVSLGGAVLGGLHDTWDRAHPFYQARRNLLSRGTRSLVKAT